MPIQLYDTLTREVRPLKADDGKRFRLYVCGPTVYGPAHIGNFITFLRSDILFRALQLDGENPYFVRNITDVDDKTIRDSLVAKKSLKEFTESWTKRFHEDCVTLNLLTPEVEPRATDHIAEQIDLVEKLIEGGFAYVGGDGSVYYKVAAFADYGKLSHFDPSALKTQSENSAGTTNLADEYDRESVSDFALWKSEKPEDGGNAWDSPWGRGRPGWHLECSAMSRKYLGDTFDLHGGGEDLCFPHHENEIAQSEAATGKPFARHWMHGIHLLVEGKKMSKSLGNFFTVEDLLKLGHEAQHLRLALLGGHYRQQFNFTLKAIDAAKSAYQRIEKNLWTLLAIAGEEPRAFPSQTETALPPEWGPFSPVWNAICDDLNTPAALGQLHSILKGAGEVKTPEEAAAWLRGLAAVCYLFGLSFAPAEKEALDIPSEIEALAAERWNAKQNREFAKADSLRAELLQAGWKVLDRKDGYSLEIER